MIIALYIAAAVIMAVGIRNNLPKARGKSNAAGSPVNESITDTESEKYEVPRHLYNPGPLLPKPPGTAAYA